MGKPNRSKAKRVQKRYQGDGCWYCSPWEHVLKWRAAKEKVLDKEVISGSSNR